MVWGVEGWGTAAVTLQKGHRALGAALAARISE